MKNFEVPEIEIIRFAVEDIITTSGSREDELPLEEGLTTSFRITGV